PGKGPATQRPPSSVSPGRSELPPPSPPRGSPVPGAARTPAGTPTPTAQRPPPSTPGAARTPAGTTTPTGQRFPASTPGSRTPGGTPTPSGQRPPSSAGAPRTPTGIGTPGELPQQAIVPLEFEDDETTAQRLGTPRPVSAVKRAPPQPSDPSKPDPALRLSGDTERTVNPAAVKPGPPAAEAPAAPEMTRPGNASISFDRILIIRLSALGDCVHALPAFANLRRAFPHAKIAWAIEDRFASLLDGLPGLDQVIVFPRREFKGSAWRPWAWPGNLLRVMRLKRVLRAFAPTVAFDFQGNTKSGLHAKLCGAPARIGFDDAKEGAQRYYNFRVKTAGVMHRVERPLELLHAAGVPVTVSRISPIIPERDRAAIDGWLREKGARNTVVCHVGTSAFGAIKRWPREKWARLGGLLSRDGYRTVIFAWGPGERELAESVARDVPGGRGLLGPDTPRIGTLAALVERSSVFVGCDSGPLHLAAMMNVPVVGIYGPKDPAVYGPWCDKNVVVWKGMPCSPCSKRECDIPDCMHLIEPEEVATAAEGLLTRIKSPAAARADTTGDSLWARAEDGKGMNLDE
ncbi:MAG: hypothetical protein K8T20_01085, partial [Planctomycetes bacterium]|nr:hypothetical protein [Planctomycetota bacterium]